MLRLGPGALRRPRWLAGFARARRAPDLTVPNMAGRDEPAPTFFGAGAVFTCDGATNSTDCKFNYNYTAPSRQANRPRLIVRHWQDKGTGSGTSLKETFHGDIASS